MEDGSEEKLRLQYLLGKSMSYPEIMFDMDDRMAMPMAAADDGMGRMEMAMAAGPQPMAMGIAEAAPNAMNKNAMGGAAMAKEAPE
jgi:hypothetical protein